MLGDFIFLAFGFLVGMFSFQYGYRIIKNSNMAIHGYNIKRTPLSSMRLALYFILYYILFMNSNIK